MLKMQWWVKIAGFGGGSVAAIVPSPPNPTDQINKPKKIAFEFDKHQTHNKNNWLNDQFDHFIKQHQAFSF